MAYWQTLYEYGKRGRDLEKDDPLLCEIKEMKDRAKTQKELVVLWFYRKNGIDSNYY